jgi:glutamate formiminotransferase
MATKLIECVPNFSEGRRPEVVDAVANAVSRVPGVILLDRSSDVDHNRTVLTLVGSPEGLKEAILNLYAEVAKHVDLTQHTGEHPRMGAVDVVPFIPVRNATMADCVALSEEVGAAVAERFDVPVFLYAEAAKRSERKLLSAIRKGEFEGMAAKMQDPTWSPDFGPGQPHPKLGASAFGARPFLIAYNIQLGTADLTIASAISKAVRASSGGLMNVQAMGVFLADRNVAQVSMNLLNYEKTPIYRVQELVKAEAARFGVPVIGSEVIGLVPQAALLDAAAYYLQIENWSPALVLENTIMEKESNAELVSR